MRAPDASRALARTGWLAAGALLLLGAGCQQTVMFVTDGGGGGSGGNSGSFCPSGAFPLYPPIAESPNVVVALDRSLAMATGSFGGKTQLAAAQDALYAVVGKYDALVKFAYVDFPSADFNCNSQNLECCAIQVEATQDAYDFDNKQHACDGSNSPGCPMSSERPTRAALMSCKDFYSQPQSNQGFKRYVLLVTDGDPTPGCSGSGGGTCPDETMIVSQLRMNGVRTAIVALNLPVDSCLTQLGQLGSVINNSTAYVSASSPQELSTALDDVVGTMATDACTLDLSGSPGGSPDFTLFLNGAPIAQGMDGWQYTDNSHTRIKLSDTACQMYLANPGTLALLGCNGTHH